MRRIHTHLISITLLAFCLCSACREEIDYREYTGSNEIKVIAEETALTPQLNDTISVTILRAVAKETQELTISVNDDPEGFIECPTGVYFEGSARRTTFYVTLKKGITVSKTFWPSLAIALRPQGKPSKLYLSVSKSKPQYAPTEAEKNLIALWESRGYPLGKILGKHLPVELTVSWPANGGLVDFRDAGSSSYRGVTTLSLSPVATQDSLVLKFDWNALGLTEFFYFALRKMTIENDEFWLSPGANPLVGKVMKLIDWNRQSHEEFECSLDSVAIGAKDAYGISRVNTMHENFKDNATNPEYNTPFNFQYSAWDRLLHLIQAGDPTAIECQASMATPFPKRHLNTVDFHHSRNHDRLPPYVSEYDDKPLREQRVSIDWNTGIFSFDIQTGLTDVTIDYIDIKGTIQLPLK